jgi:hypothetical protein
VGPFSGGLRVRIRLPPAEGPANSKARIDNAETEILIIAFGLTMVLRA